MSTYSQKYKILTHTKENLCFGKLFATHSAWVWKGLMTQRICRSGEEINKQPFSPKSTHDEGIYCSNPNTGFLFFHYLLSKGAWRGNFTWRKNLEAKNVLVILSSNKIILFLTFFWLKKNLTSRKDYVSEKVLFSCISYLTLFVFFVGKKIYAIKLMVVYNFDEISLLLSSKKSNTCACMDEIFALKF